MRLIVVLLVAIFLWGCIMPGISKPIVFTLCLDGPAEAISGAEVYFEGVYIGTTAEDGCLQNCTVNSRNDAPSEGVNFTVKKEGYPDFSGGLMARDDRPIRRLTYDFAPLSVSKPPVNPPQPSSTAILQNRTAELRNETAILQNRTEEYEQRLTWLEEMVQKIIGFLRSLGFKD